MGGNHFIEVGVDLEGNHWLTAHTGSRQFGERVCRYWQTVPAAQERAEAERKFEIELARIKDTHRSKAERKKIPSLIKEAKEKLGLDHPAKGHELDWIEGGCYVGLSD